MEILEVRLDDKGQVSLPKAIREQAGRSEGTLLLAVIEDARIVLETRDEVRHRVWEAAPAPSDTDPVDEVRAERRADRARSDEAHARRSARPADDRAGERLLEELGL